MKDFDAKTYREICDALRASEETIMEVMEMANGQKIKRFFTKRALIIAAAAVLALALAVAAYATGGFGLLLRTVEPGERFQLTFGGAQEGLYWENAKLVLEFDGPEESHKIRFKPGWLPVDYVEYWNTADDEGFFRRLDGEGQEDGSQPYLIEVHYAAEFLNGGHLILLEAEPVEIAQETWGDYQIIKFDGISTIPALSYTNAKGELFERPEYTYERSYCLMYHQTGGYLLVLSGETDVETLEHIGKTLTVDVTDEVISADEYTDLNVLMDGGKG